MHRRLPLLMALVTAAALAGCAGSQRAADPADAVVGTWTYTLASPQGDLRGEIVLNKIDGVLGGTFDNEVAAQPAPLQDIVLDGSDLTFRFDGGQYGIISGSLRFEGDTVSGALTIPNMGDMPLTGTRVGG